MGDFSSSVSLSGPVRRVRRSVRHNFILVTFGEWRKKRVVCMANHTRGRFCRDLMRWSDCGLEFELSGIHLISAFSANMGYCNLQLNERVSE